jgi:hypothetical protein
VRDTSRCRLQQFGLTLAALSHREGVREKETRVRYFRFTLGQDTVLMTMIPGLANEEDGCTCSDKVLDGARMSAWVGRDGTILHGVAWCGCLCMQECERSVCA